MTQEPKYIVLLGPPGSGKGTQAARVSASLNLPHVASGDLFRFNLDNKTKLGLEANVYINRGELVPDDVTIAMVLDRLSQPDCRAGALLDGFPRTLPQAEALDRALAVRGHKVSKVPLITLADKVVVERLSGRLICPNARHPSIRSITHSRPVLTTNARVSICISARTTNRKRFVIASQCIGNRRAHSSIIMEKRACW